MESTVCIHSALLVATIRSQDASTILPSERSVRTTVNAIPTAVVKVQSNGPLVREFYGATYPCSVCQFSFQQMPLAVTIRDPKLYL
jgi:hypothetical protein